MTATLADARLVLEAGSRLLAESVEAAMALARALGIAGSYSGGLIEFSRCQEGAMIKRLHLGKAAEGGVTAAHLASRGFAGPESVLEGKFGFCKSFSDSPDLGYLTHRLGEEWESYWEMMGEIDRAHRHAGQRIRTQLLR